MFALIHKICARFNIDWKFIKFLFVGALNTLFGYGAFALLIFCGLYYPLANFFSIIMGIIFNFFTTGYLVFANSDIRLLKKFCVVYALNWLLNTFIMWICEQSGYTNFYVIGAILLLPMAMLSFTLMKYFVFTRRKENE